MASGTELATAYISIVGETSKLKKNISDALAGVDEGPAKKTGSRLGGALATSLGVSVGSGSKGAARQALDGFENEAHPRAAAAGARVGQVAGKAIGAALKLGIAGAAAAATSAVGLVGYTLTKGFQRLEKIDQATFKLKALGHSADEVASIMKSAKDSVDKTAFSLADAADAAAAATAAGVKPGEQLTQYLKDIGDLSAVANKPLDDTAAIFNKIQTTNKTYLEDLQQLPGVPIFQWLQEAYGVTADKLSDMVSKGEVDAAHFQQAIETHIGGAAKTMGEGFSGAVDNMETAVARLGANFLTAIFGGDGVNALAGPEAAIHAITDRLDQLNGWVTAHSGEIKQFFIDAWNKAKDVAGAIKDIAGFFDDIGVSAGDAAAIVATVWAGSKIAGIVAGAKTAIEGIAGAFGGIGPAAETAAGSANAALAGITAPAWLIAFLAGGSYGLSQALDSYASQHPEITSDGRLGDPTSHSNAGSRRSGQGGNPNLAPINTAPGMSVGPHGRPGAVYVPGLSNPPAGSGNDPFLLLPTSRGYDSGGPLPPGLTLANNMTGKHEYVLTPEQIQWLQQNGIDPASIQGGMPPPPGMPGQMGKGSDGASLLAFDSGRTEGYIPAAAGNTGKTGGGVAGDLLGLGGEFAKGAIDTAAQAATMAAGIGTMGGGGAAAGAGIQAGASAAKRGVDFLTQMGGIGIGALSEILLPFGAPRWLTDVSPTSFMPQHGVNPAAVTSAEQQRMPQPIDPMTDQHGNAMGAAPGPASGIEGIPQGDQPGLVVTNNVSGVDPNAIPAMIDAKTRLAVMQYSGRPFG